jgi:hypothetical protein
MDQKEAAIDQVERPRGQARVGGARLDEPDMRAGAVEALAGLGELRAAGVDADDVPPGTD